MVDKMPSVEERLANLEMFMTQAADLLNDLNERVYVLQKALGKPPGGGVKIEESQIISFMEAHGVPWEEAKARLLNGET